MLQTFDFDDASGNNDTGATSEDQDQNLGYKPDNNITSTNNIDSSKSPHINLSNSDENLSSIGNNNPDSGFINTLRYGMLAVRLLPQTSISSKLLFCNFCNMYTNAILLGIVETIKIDSPVSRK